jgi:hypothetical protein
VRLMTALSTAAVLTVVLVGAGSGNGAGAAAGGVTGWRAEVTITPEEAVFASNAPLDVAATVRVTGTGGVVDVEDIAGYDPRCVHGAVDDTLGSYEETPDPGCDRWLGLDSTSTAGTVRTLALSGEIPNLPELRGGAGSGVGSGAGVLVMAKIGGHWSTLRALSVGGAVRSSLTVAEGAEGVGVGDTIVVDALRERFTTDWEPESGRVQLQQLADGSAGGWKIVASVPPGEDGHVEFRVRATASGMWRTAVHDDLDRGDGAVDDGVRTSTAVRVNVRAPAGVPPVVVPPAGAGTSAVPPSAPRRLTVVPGARRIALGWRTPSGGGTVDHYQVKRSGSGAGARPVVVGAPVWNYIWRGLVNGREYTVSVRAHSRGGWGAWASRTVRAGAVRPATAGPWQYKSCRQMHRLSYHHGVGRPGARDKVKPGAHRSTEWVRDRRVYVANRRLDVDGDGIACER